MYYLFSAICIFFVKNTKVALVSANSSVKPCLCHPPGERIPPTIPGHLCDTHCKYNAYHTFPSLAGSLNSWNIQAGWGQRFFHLARTLKTWSVPYCQIGKIDFCFEAAV